MTLRPMARPFVALTSLCACAVPTAAAGAPQRPRAAALACTPDRHGAHYPIGTLGKQRLNVIKNLV